MVIHVYFVEKKRKGKKKNLRKPDKYVLSFMEVELYNHMILQL